MIVKVLIFLLVVVVAICQFKQSHALTTSPSLDRRILKEKYSSFLVDLISGPTDNEEITFDGFAADLVETQNKSLIMAIFGTAIDEMFDYETPEMVAAYLQKLHRDNSLPMFEVMVHAQLHLYWKFVNRHYINDLYTFNVAYYLRTIKNDHMFAQLDTTAKRRVDEAIASLPSSMQYLFFKPYFCLLNKEYQEYIYTTVDIYINDEAKYIFAWNSTSYVDEHGKWVAVFNESSDENSTGKHLNVKVALKSLMYKKYLYLEPKVNNLRNVTASWLSMDAPVNTDWTVQLVDGQLVFEQNGSLMCASCDLYKSYRRYVFGLNDVKHTPSSPACQWKAGECRISEY